MHVYYHMQMFNSNVQGGTQKRLILGNFMNSINIFFLKVFLFVLKINIYN